MAKFQYFNANVKAKKPLGYVSLDYFIKSTKTPKKNIVSIFNKIQLAEINNDFILKKQLKQSNLFFFTPCVNLSGGRSYNNIVCFTGLMVLDFDHIDNAIDFKYYLFNNYRSIIATWLSPSGKGVKAFLRIPTVSSVKEFKSFFYGVSDVMMDYNGFDSSGQNSVLPLFQSYDPGLLHRSAASCWRRKGVKNNKINYTKKIPVTIPDNNNYSNTIIKIINTGFRNINANGHPQLRSLCLTVGGYVSSGYINHDSAISHINNCININYYLQKDVRNYVKTALWAVNEGMKSPIKLNFLK